MNPGRLLLFVGGVIAVIVGVRGSQKQSLAALTGKGLPSSALPSATQASPANGHPTALLA